jgi:hypothetical protein
MIHDWSRLFSDDGFRWQMGLRAGDAHSFFAPTPERGEILAERNRWLDESPADYAVLTNAGQALLWEMHEFAVKARSLSPAADCALETLGRELEPDFVLLTPSANGPLVVGGVVCFPSSWSLPEKVGLTLDQTHHLVPGLNPQLGERIRTALDRLPPEVAWKRENWGLSRDGERNHHPRQIRKRLDEKVEPDEIWFRVEHQILYRLPRTNAYLFGIRLTIRPLIELTRTPARVGLRKALESMPDEIAKYKGLLSARERIAALLKAEE